MQSITLESEPRSVGRARRFVAAACVERHIDPSVAELLTSELATNVVLYAKSEFTVRVGFEPCARVEVHDGLCATNAFPRDHHQSARTLDRLARRSRPPGSGTLVEPLRLG